MSSVQNRLKTELFSVAMKHIYTTIAVCERERERQEREDGHKECLLEDCFHLQYDWHEWIERTQTTSDQQRASQHYMNIHRQFVIRAVASSRLCSLFQLKNTSQTYTEDLHLPLLAKLTKLRGDSDSRDTTPESR